MRCSFDRFSPTATSTAPRWTLIARAARTAARVWPSIPLSTAGLTHTLAARLLGQELNQRAVGRQNLRITAGLPDVAQPPGSRVEGQAPLEHVDVAAERTEVAR